ncbi:YheC/D like ATP-grasp [Paenibacillus sophorae]|uniref:YheC/D like ATP-grasp n=1 Tax=Paenibacillus sophorae TaxID=1333845 RepID=A0A1H8Q2M3_9BACL|nr:YheC/YheD family protein [Paenibacillus sophorae]QWU15307.1 YheC/YheD family protein [Paenibacillus sophorae]SEO48013.1 YheC/D like ATP-grasp [Paenibacillus sophorae]
MAGRQLASKWRKTEALLSDSRISGYIPKTMPYSNTALHSMLQRYGNVVIKPIVGGGGYGVIKVFRDGRGYGFTYMDRTRIYRDYSSMAGALKRVRVKRSYLIQQGISLARIAGRPIDYRVKVVKNGEHWEFRSMVGRLARPGLFVTNLCKGGTMLTCREGLRRSLPRIKISAKRTEMRNLTITCIGVLERHFPGIGELGFDYAVDRSGRIWILEVNTRPQ